MTEGTARPSGHRRGSGRGGRGAHSGRGRSNGGRGAAAAAASAAATSESAAGPPSTSAPIVDEGEFGELKQKYASQLPMLKEMFPNWSDDDIVFALEETDGDLERTINHMAEGNTSHWGEVKKKSNKDKSMTKQIKELAMGAAETTKSAARTAGKTGGISEGTQSTRGRGQDRGRGSSRGGRGARGAANGFGVASSTSRAPYQSSSNQNGWGQSEETTSATEPASSDWQQTQNAGWGEDASEAQSSGAGPDSQPSSRPDGTKSWASIFAKPKMPPAPRAASSAPKQQIANGTGNDEAGIQGLPPPLADDLSQVPNTPPTGDLASTEQLSNLAPSKDNLTETNLEKVPDISAPAATATAASTVASTVDHRAMSGAGSMVTGVGAPSSRPPIGGYATTALKATSTPGRSSSFQRRIAEQQEAVVMPAKHSVDKTAVQFGSMGLNGDGRPETDGDREDPETRVQPPQHSPVAPRASLPPSIHQPPQPQQPHQPFQDELQERAGLQSQPQLQQQQHHHQYQNQDSSMSRQSADPIVQGMSHPNNLPHSLQHNLPPGYNYGQSLPGRFAPSMPHPDGMNEPSSRAYEPYEQANHSSQQSSDPFNNDGMSHGLVPDQRQSLTNKYPSASQSNHNMSSYYGADDHRSPYPGAQYASGLPNSQQQQAASSQQSHSQSQSQGDQESDHASQRTGSIQAAQPSHTQGRFGQPIESNSGHSTPYGSVNGHPAGSQQSHLSQAGGPSHHGSYGYGSYPYGGYYSSYNMNQYGYGGGQNSYGNGSFGGSAANRNGYGQQSQAAQQSQHPGYGMSPQLSHHEQHGASPANIGVFGQQGLGSMRDANNNSANGFGGYGGRAGSTTQSSDHASGAQGVSDPFARGLSPYHHAAPHGLGNGASAASNEDSYRNYGDSSKISGSSMSPAMGQPGRPSSAANHQGHSSLPPQDARFGQHHPQQTGYGGYPSTGQYGQAHGVSGTHGHQGPNYGAYGAGGNYYGGGVGGGNNRGGWANYGH